MPIIDPEHQRHAVRLAMEDPEMRAEAIRALRLQGFRIDPPGAWVDNDVIRMVERVTEASGTRPRIGRCGLMYWNALRALAASRLAQEVPVDVDFLELHGVRFTLDRNAIAEAVYIGGDPQLG